MRVLAITKLFPNAAEPLSAPFNRQQFAALAERCELEVLATIPWYPGAGLLARWSSAGQLAGVPRRETIAGMEVRHPRTLFVPRLAHATWGPLYAASLAPLVARYRKRIDVVLGAWAYPDGFASVVLARLLGVPCVVKLHGSDINVVAKLRGARRMTAWALAHAAKIVAVSRPLADEVAALGVPADRVTVVMNGVDSDLFYPRDRAAARAELGLSPGPLAVYVGNLKEVKGVMDLAAAWALVPDATLAVVGDGYMREPFGAAVAPLGSRVHLAGIQPLERIPLWMAAADVIVLPSHHEGTPNVVLEAFAMGRRVVATRVGGVPDLITRPELGAMVPAHDPAAFAEAVTAALRVPYDGAEVARLGARGGWAASAAALHRVLVDATVEYGS